MLSLCSSVETKTTNVFSVLAAALLTGRSVSLPALPSGEVRRGTPKGSNGTNAALVEHTQAHTKVRIFMREVREGELPSPSLVRALHQRRNDEVRTGTKSGQAIVE